MTTGWGSVALGERMTRSGWASRTSAFSARTREHARQMEVTLSGSYVALSTRTWCPTARLLACRSQRSMRLPRPPGVRYIRHMTYVKAAIRAAESADVPVMYGLAQDEIGGDFAPGHALQVLERCEVFVARVEDVSCGYVAVDE